MSISDNNLSANTLPTLRDVVSQVEMAPRLQCTILFHPQVERIGQHALLPDDVGEVMLGRNGPLFRATGEDSAFPLEDPYLSRRALLVSTEQDGVRLQRPEQASRCRLQGRELQGDLFIDNASLERGVPLLLSHSVVLLLRRCVAPLAADCPPQPDGLVGVSAAMQVVRKQIRRAADSDLDVLIRGETGVGKELVARAICAGSRRAAAPLVTVNMAAIPPTLAAAFLFGNTRGAFTGAERARQGYFREAHGGTLFLDEVGDTPEEIQPLLLRALQQGEVQVVGGDTQTVDVRVVSATDAALDGAECDFKSALLYRLCAMEIIVPALRERPEDLGVLLMHFLSEASDQEAKADLLPRIDSEPMHLARWAQLFFRFACYSWPGNIRQLENFATQLVIASDSSPVIPPTVLAAFDEAGAVVAKRQSELRRKMRDISEREFDEAMERLCYEVGPVAERLGVSRQSVYRRIDQSRIYRRASEVPAEELQATLSCCVEDVRSTAVALKVSESALRARLRAVGPVGGR